MLNELGPQFERNTGHKLVTRFAATSVVKRAIDAGAAVALIKAKGMEPGTPR